jgi:hypothetical protein
MQVPAIHIDPLADPPTIDWPWFEVTWEQRLLIRLGIVTRSKTDGHIITLVLQSSPLMKSLLWASVIVSVFGVRSWYNFHFWLLGLSISLSISLPPTTTYG